MFDSDKKVVIHILACISVGLFVFSISRFYEESPSFYKEVPQKINKGRSVYEWE